MLPHLLHALPDRIGHWPTLAVVGLSAAGAGLWLCGARYSRGIVTLLGVSLGAAIGLHLPEWFDWTIDGMGLAFVGAMVLGLAGYLLHATWVGAALATVLALWAGTVTWIAQGGANGWTMPRADWSSGPTQILSAIWQSLPPRLAQTLPAALAAGFAAGIVLAVFLPRVARVLAYSLIGLTVLVSLGLPAVQMSRPQWFVAIPARTSVQVAILCGLTLFGAGVQWMLLPRRARDGASHDASTTGRPRME